MSDHVIAHIGSGNLFCRHCGAAEPMRTGTYMELFTGALEAFLKAHRACPKPATLHEPPLPDRTLPVDASLLAPWPGLETWLRHGETGMSSETLAAAITGLAIADRRTLPLDAQDFRRCVGLLEAVPSMRDAMQTEATRARLSPGWHALLAAWPELEGMLHAGDTNAVTERLAALQAHRRSTPD